MNSLIYDIERKKRKSSFDTNYCVSISKIAEIWGDDNTDDVLLQSWHKTYWEDNILNNCESSDHEDLIDGDVNEPAQFRNLEYSSHQEYSDLDDDENIWSALSSFKKRRAAAELVKEGPLDDDGKDIQSMPFPLLPPPSLSRKRKKDPELDSESGGDDNESLRSMLFSRKKKPKETKEKKKQKVPKKQKREKKDGGDDESELNPDLWHPRLYCKIAPTNYQAYTTEIVRDKFNGKAMIAFDTGLGKTLQSLLGMMPYFHNFCSFTRNALISILIECQPQLGVSSLKGKYSIVDIIFHYASTSCQYDEWPSKPLVISTINTDLARQTMTQILKHTNIPGRAIRIWNQKLFGTSTRLKKQGKNKDITIEQNITITQNKKKSLLYTAQQTKDKIDPAWFSTHKYRPWIEIMTHAASRSHVEWIKSNGVRCLILDESHAIKNAKSGMTLQLVPLLQRIPRVFLLTATSLDRPIHVFTQMNAIRPGVLGSRNDFIAYFCHNPKKGKYLPIEQMDERGANKARLPELSDILTRNGMIRIKEENKNSFHPSKPWSPVYSLNPPKDPKEVNDRIRTILNLPDYVHAQSMQHVQDFWEESKNVWLSKHKDKSTSSGKKTAPTRATNTEFKRIILHIDPPMEIMDKILLTTVNLKMNHPTLKVHHATEIALSMYDDHIERLELFNKIKEYMSNKTEEEIIADNMSKTASGHKKGAHLSNWTRKAGLSSKKAFVRNFIRTKILAKECETNKVTFFGDSHSLTESLWEVAESVCKPRGVGMIRLDSNVSTKDREVGLEKFQTDPKCRIAFVGQRSGGTGLEWTAANFVVFTEIPWNWSVFKQVYCRVSGRISQLRDVCVIVLFLHDSLDSIKWKLILSKASNISLVMDNRKHEFQYTDYNFIKLHPCKNICCGDRIPNNSNDDHD